MMHIKRDTENLGTQEKNIKKLDTFEKWHIFITQNK
jgi:hypothetical protein